MKNGFWEPGDRVRICSGQYAGELGNVVPMPSGTAFYSHSPDCFIRLDRGETVRTQHRYVRSASSTISHDGIHVVYWPEGDPRNKAE